MNNGFESSLTLASEQLLSVIESQYEAEKDSIIFVELSAEQVSDLSNKILALPNDNITMLLLRYSFGFNDSDISTFIRHDRIKGKIRYIERLLSTCMGLSETEGISRDGIRSACKIVLEKYTEDEGAEISPRYSYQFLKRMQSLKLVRGPSLIFPNVLQKVAAVSIILGLAFGITLGVNAEFREKTYHWIIETFTKFSDFILNLDEKSEEYSFEELVLYKPTFLPDGYKIDSTLDLNPSVYYNCINDNGDTLIIIGHLPEKAIISLNTENAEIEEVIFGDEDAFYWEKDGISYFVFGVDGYHFNIFGQINRDVIIQIAENIKKE